MRQMNFVGTVTSGKGRGNFFVSLPWAKKQFMKVLGFNPYSGTLNLTVLQGTDTRILRDTTKGIKIVPEEGFYVGRCFKALVLGEVEGAVVIPDVPDYPDDLVEIVAPVNLRNTLKLRDGMNIEITIWA